MRVLHGLLLCGVGCLFAAGCASYQVPGAEKGEHGSYLFTSSGTALVEAPGDLRELTKAKMAAEAIARANLMKKIKGVHLTETVSVEDLVFSKQMARLETAGWLSRAEITFEQDTRRIEDEVVHAHASLTLTRRDLDNLRKYVE